MNKTDKMVSAFFSKREEKIDFISRKISRDFEQAFSVKKFWKYFGLLSIASILTGYNFIFVISFFLIAFEFWLKENNN